MFSLEPPSPPLESDFRQLNCFFFAISFRKNLPTSEHWYSTNEAFSRVPSTEICCHLSMNTGLQGSSIRVWSVWVVYYASSSRDERTPHVSKLTLEHFMTIIVQKRRGRGRKKKWNRLHVYWVRKIKNSVCKYAVKSFRPVTSELANPALSINSKMI